MFESFTTIKGFFFSTIKCFVLVLFLCIPFLISSIVTTKCLFFCFECQTFKCVLGIQSFEFWSNPIFELFIFLLCLNFSFFHLQVVMSFESFLFFSEPCNTFIFYCYLILHILKLRNFRFFFLAMFFFVIFFCNVLCLFGQRHSKGDLNLLLGESRKVWCPHFTIEVNFNILNFIVFFWRGVRKSMLLIWVCFHFWSFVTIYILCFWWLKMNFMLLKVCAKLMKMHWLPPFKCLFL